MAIANSRWGSAALAGVGLALAVGCTSPKHYPPGSSADPNYHKPGFAPGAHTALPRVLDAGGRIITNPAFHLLTFPGEPFAASLASFVARYAVSSAWTSLANEYALGTASVPAAAVFSASPPAAITDANLQTSLSTELNDIAAPFGAPDDHAIYLIELPQGTSLSIGAASTCMNHFEEYFNTYTDGASGKTITYAVIAHCASDTIDDSTRRMSEEIVDAATDPDIGLSYHGVDSDSLVWSIAYGGRLASLCDVEPDFVHQNIITPSDIGFVILRAWSNSAAVSGQDPCRPSPTQFYFNSAPVLPDTVTFFDSDFGQSFTTKGVHIPLNSTRTLTLQLFSTGDIAPWSLALGQYSNDLAFQTVTHSFDRSSGSNGTIVHLNLTPTATDPEYGGELMEIRSTYNGHTNVWPFIITN